MCELMGLCFSRPVSAAFSIREFARRGTENAHGWGLAWYPDQSLALVKEPLAWHESRYTAFLEKDQQLLSAIYVAHVRHKTVGGSPTHADTHPFGREWAGREYCFAHNGTLAHFREALPLRRYMPVGGTDSEHAFCYLLDQVAQYAAALDTELSWRWLADRLAAVNQLGTFNCLFSDGRRLFAYHDAAGYKGLTLRKVRNIGKPPRRFEDNELRFDVEGELNGHGFVVATCSLSPGGWHPLRPGELLVLEAGELSFSSRRSSHPPGPVDS